MSRRILPTPAPRVQLDVALAIVNIVLLLILFFLATGSLLNAPTSDVDLANTQELPIDILPQPTLIIDATGGFILNGEELPAETGLSTLAELPLLHVLIDRAAPASELLTLLSDPALTDTEIRLVTLHTKAEAP